MYEPREQKFTQVGDLKVSQDRSIRISKFRGGGYSIVVMDIYTDDDGYLCKRPLKGAVIVPNDDKMTELAYLLLDIAHQE